MNHRVAQTNSAHDHGSLPQPAAHKDVLQFYPHQKRFQLLFFTPQLSCRKHTFPLIVPIKMNAVLSISTIHKIKEPIPRHRQRKHLLAIWPKARKPQKPQTPQPLGRHQRDRLLLGHHLTPPTVAKIGASFQSI